MGKGNLNPADAERKKQRHKELVKNRNARKVTREEKLAKKDTFDMEEEIRVLTEKEDANKLTDSERNRLTGLRFDLARAKKVKEAYLKDHPDEHGQVYRTRRPANKQSAEGGAPRDARGRKLKTRRIFDEKTGLPRHPERSLYYDKVMNPYGVAPPGMPYAERPLLPGEVDSDAEQDEDESEDDIALPSADDEDDIPMPEDDDDLEGIPMPPGPPPWAMTQEEEEDFLPPLPSTSESTNPPLPPHPLGHQQWNPPLPPGPPLPAGFGSYGAVPLPPPGGPVVAGIPPPPPGGPPITHTGAAGIPPPPPGGPPFVYGIPPPPPGGPPGWKGIPPPPPGGPPIAFGGIPPPPPGGPPAFFSGMIPPPPPGGPPAAYTVPPPPPGGPPAMHYDAMHGRGGPSLSYVPPLPYVPPPSAAPRASHRPFIPPASAGLPPRPNAPPAVISAEPELVDFKKEATTFVPNALKRKRPASTSVTGVSGSVRMDAASDVAGAEETTIGPSMPPDLLGAVRKKVKQ